MNLVGKYRVDITDKNGNKRHYETKNHIVDNGIRQVLDWLSFDLYSHNSFQGLKKLTIEEMYFPENTLETPTSMDYPESVLDYEEIDETDYYYDEDYPVDLKKFHNFKYNKSTNNTYATIDNFRNGKQSITLFFTDGAIMLSAINLDAQMFSKQSEKNNETISFDIEYREINDVTWRKLPVNYTLTNDNERRQLTFFVCPNVPPFTFIPCTALKFTFNVKKNTLGTENNLIGRIYNISVFKAHHIPQPPMVMKFGTGTEQVENSQTNLENFVYSQVVTYTKKYDQLEKPNTISYVVEIPNNKCNDVEISEIGMFYRYDYVNPTQQHIQQTVKNTNEMFSRALFTNDAGKITPWKKSDDEEIVIAYDITVSNEAATNK